MKRIAIIDYGMSNLHSVLKAINAAAGDDVEVTAVNNQDDIANADKIVFPGQGAALDCMNSLNASGLTEAIVQAMTEKPFLGICMGLQVLFERSQENNGTACLGLFPGEARRFKNGSKSGRKIPHMGWNQIKQRIKHPLWHRIENNSHFYFAHSYYTVSNDQSIIAGTSNYGDNFTCALASDFIFAVQFHPEKSAQNGLQLLSNFIHWEGTPYQC